MATYTVHGGHAAQGKAYCGAVGLLDESVEDRLIKDAMIKYLRQGGATVYDCTVDTGTSQRNVLSQICAKCNAVASDLDISVHFNSDRNDYKGDGKQGGFEIYATAYTGIKLEVATRMVNKMQPLGFGLHGKPLKTTSGLYFLNHTNAPALLLEICFVDDKDDYDLYKKVGADAIGKALAEAVLNKTISQTGQEVKKMAEVQLYDLNGTDAQKWYVKHNSDGTYSFENKACGLYLDVEAGSTKQGAKVQAYEKNGTNSQKFIITQYSGYTPSFVAPIMITPLVNKNYVLDCVSAGKSNGTKIQTYSSNKTAAQKWTIVDNGDGTWTFINVNSSKALDVVGGGK